MGGSGLRGSRLGGLASFRTNPEVGGTTVHEDRKVLWRGPSLDSGNVANVGASIKGRWLIKALTRWKVASSLDIKPKGICGGGCVGGCKAIHVLSIEFGLWEPLAGCRRVLVVVGHIGGIAGS